MKEQILKTVKQMEEYEEKAYALGRRKLFILGGGFAQVRSLTGDWDNFKRLHGAERIDFEQDKIYITFYDTYYDLRDYCGTHLSYEEFALTEEENIKKWTLQRKEANEQARLQKQKEDWEKQHKKEQQERLEFERLKAKFEAK